MDINGENVSILLYADDIVLIAENEHDLQNMLNILNTWCSSNSMNVNPAKSNIVHFRNPSVERSNFVFTIGDNQLNYVTRY